MQQLNKVEAKDIKRLDGGQLVRLLHLLLCTEARSRNIGQAGIHVPFEINVRDGGSDGQWSGEIDQNDYIPDKLTFYQSKAQEMGPKDCADEIHKDNSTELKSQVQKVLDAGGAYVFFCSHPYNPDLIDARIIAARNALREAGRTTWEADKIHFLDGTLIAQWVNLHTSAFAYVCRCTGIWQDVVLRDYLHWKEGPDFEYDFKSNDILDGFIADLRAALTANRSVARITGPSGVGKTRLAFEVFHAPGGPDIEKVRKCLCESVVYLDMQIFGRETLSWVSQLALNGYLGIVVVDNCPRKDHNILQKTIQHPDCRLSLLTLDYVPESPFGDGSLHISLTPEIMRDVVPKILGSVPGLKQKLGDGGISRIADFAHGFPQIAILTAHAGHALDLPTLNQQGELANRLLWGWGQEDHTAKEIIRCLAPFSEIGWAGSHSVQFDFVRSELCNGLGEYDFRRFTKQFFEKRVLQEVGDFLLVTPPPLAVALAADWLEDVTDTHFQLLLPKIEACGLLDSFCRRLRQLDFSTKAQALCEKLLGISGPFFSAEVLNSEAGSRVFRALSEINPLAATECLYRLTASWKSANFSRVTGGRRNLIWSLEKLVWDSNLFTKAACVLRGFAAGETEHWANNATAQFCQLFHIYLPGTEMPLLERLQVIRDGLKLGNDSNIREVCVKGLGAALMSRHFSRTGGTEQLGSSSPRQDYQPSSNGEILDYWRAAYSILRDLISEGDNISSAALSTLGSNVDALLGSPLIFDLEDDFRTIAASQGNYWPSARERIKSALSHWQKLSHKHREALERWLEHVTPKDIKNRLIDVVSTPGWHHKEEPDGKFTDLSELNAFALADELARHGNSWLDHIEVLLVGEQQQAWNFGRRCMELSEQPTELFTQCLNKFIASDAKTRNPQLLRGMMNYLSGSNEASKILDRVAADTELCNELLIPLTTASAETVSDFDRVATLILKGDLPPNAVNSFAFGSVTSNFDPVLFRTSLGNLKSLVPDTAPWILHVTFMYCQRSQSRFEVMSKLLADLVLMPEAVSKLGVGMVGHAWEVTVQELLKDTSEEFVERLTRVLVDFIISSEVLSYSEDYVIRAAQQLLQKFPQVAWPIFAGALRDDKGRPRFSLIEFLSRTGHFGESGVPLWELPSDDFREWANFNRDLLPYFLRLVPLFSVERSKNPSQTMASNVTETSDNDVLSIPRPGDRYIWHPHAKVLLELCGKDQLRGCLISNLFSFGSTGSRVPYLQKRIALVEDLSHSDDSHLRDIALELKGTLEQEVMREKKIDAQREAGITAW